jgi:hypothetical protein
MITVSPYKSLLPKSSSFEIIIERLELESENVTIVNPHVKIMNSPIRMVKVSGSLSEFKEQDAKIDTVMAVLSG